MFPLSRFGNTNGAGKGVTYSPSSDTSEIILLLAFRHLRCALRWASADRAGACTQIPPSGVPPWDRPIGSNRYRTSDLPLPRNPAARRKHALFWRSTLIAYRSFVICPFIGCLHATLIVDPRFNSFRSTGDLSC